MSDPSTEPLKTLIMKNSLKAKLKIATETATQAFNMTEEKRLERFSFASLFRGKWGSFIEFDKPGLLPVDKAVEKMTQENSTKTKDTSGQRKKSIDTSPKERKIKMKERKKKIESVFDFIHDEQPILESKQPFNRSIFKIPYELNIQTKLTDHDVKRKKTPILESLKYVNRALEFANRNQNSIEEFPRNIFNEIKSYPKPPLPPDVLIALAVQNLDPNNKVCIFIVKFCKY